MCLQPQPNCPIRSTGQAVAITEVPDRARIRTGSILFDGLYALAVQEALQNSVAEIKDGAYNHGEPIKLEAFQTGRIVDLRVDAGFVVFHIFGVGAI